MKAIVKLTFQTLFSTRGVSLVKNYIKRYITNGIGLTDYVPIGLAENPATATLIIGENCINVTTLHFNLAYNPVVIGIVMKSELHSLQSSVKITLLIYAKEKLSCKLQLSFISDNELIDPNTILSLFHVRRCDLYQLNWLRRSSILWARFFNNRKSKKYFGSLPFSLHKQYAGVFSFPRKVVLITLSDGDFQKTFPIDLHGAIGETFFLGLRHSNEAVAHLKKGANVVVSRVGYGDYKLVYTLGKFRKKDTHEIPFQTLKTKHWQIDVPEFILDYTEVEVVSHKDIGSQCLFVGRIIHNENVREGAALYHVHLIEYLENYYR